MDQIKDALVPAVLTGGFTYVGSMLLLGTDDNYEKPVFGFATGEPLAYGALGGLAKLVSELVKDQVLPLITSDGSVLGVADLATPMVTGGSLVAMNYATSDAGMYETIPNVLKVFALGTGSDYAASYIAEKL